MEIRHLEFFLEVARLKSFSKAALSLHISQPSISKAVKELENELGKALLYRSSKFVELTDAGEAILEQAQQITASFRNIKASLDGLERLQTGKVHIGLPPITAVTTFASILGGFQKRFPGIQVHLHEYGPKRIESSLLDGLLDLGVFTPEDDALFDWVWFENDPHWLLMHPDHRLAAKTTLKYADLDREPLIIYTAEYKLHDYILGRCSQAGAVPDIRLETSQLEMMTQMVAANVGIALLPGKICQKLEGELLTARPIADARLCLELAIAWRRDRYLSHAATQFLTFFRDYVSSGRHKK